MVHVEIGPNRKLDRLTPAQRWVFVAGVLAIAAKSPIRGTLVIPPAQLATPADIRKQANVSRGVAASALARIRELGMLEPSGEIEGAEHVHDWEVYNPAPKASSREGERLRKATQRAREQLRQTGDLEAA